jgi:hypothetical protein
MESEYWSDEEQAKIKKKKDDEKETKKILRATAITVLCLSLAFSIAALLAVLNKPITHLVSFRNYDNALIATETIKDGEVATKPDITPTKPADSVNTYAFSGWDKEFTTTITEDVTFTAQYASTPIPVVTPTPTYTVRFLNDDTAKSVLYSCSITSGEKASYQGVTPTKDADSQYTYSFKGWDTDPSTVTITATKDFTAQYNKTAIPVPTPTYSVRFLDEDGTTLLYSETVTSGDKASYGNVVPTKDATSDASYKFAGWDKDINAAITANTDFKAKYDTYYEVTFLNDDGSVAGVKDIKAGEHPSLSSVNPYKNKDGYTTYTFAGWKKETSGEDASSYVLASKATFIASFTSVEAGNDGLTYALDTTVTPNEYAISGYTGTDSYVYIPETYKGLEVSKINDDAFKNNTNIVHVKAPGATTIGNFAFNGCTSLKDVSSPLATALGYGTFMGCTSLQTLDMAKVETIDGYTFTGCTSLKSINFLSVTSVGDGAFGTCSYLQYVNLPSVTVIGANSFNGCSSLQSITLPQLVRAKDEAFYGCSSLASISLPLVNKLATKVFDECPALTSVDFGTLSSAKMGSTIFYTCPNIRSLSFNNTKAEFDAFSSYLGFATGYQCFVVCTDQSFTFTAA